MTCFIFGYFKEWERCHFYFFCFHFFSRRGVKIEKQLLYDRHTLEDNYEYRKVERSFQWDKIAGMIDSLLNFENQAKEFGALSNYKNRNGRAPLSDSSRKTLIGLSKINTG